MPKASSQSQFRNFDGWYCGAWFLYALWLLAALGYTWTNIHESASEYATPITNWIEPGQESIRQISKWFGMIRDGVNRLRNSFPGHCPPFTVNRINKPSNNVNTCEFGGRVMNDNESRLEPEIITTTSHCAGFSTVFIASSSNRCTELVRLIRGVTARLRVLQFELIWLHVDYGMFWK